MEETANKPSIDIEAILDRATKTRIAVIGDLIIDKYIHGSVTRISPEAPVAVLRKTTEKEAMGGAGNVWGNLLNLGVDAHLFCDADPEAYKSDRIHPNRGPMSTKIRLMSGGQHLLRVDDEIAEEEITGTIFKDVEWKDKFLELLPTFDAIVISDYHKGSVSKSIAEMVVAHANDADVPVIVDAKKWFERFGGADIVKCNSSEWEQAKKHYQLNTYTDAIDYFGFNIMVVTEGSKGMTVATKPRDMELSAVSPGFSVQVSDTCGAGDTVTAILALCLANFSAVAAAHMYTLANIAASEVCRHPGVYAITAADLIRRVREVGL